MIPGASGGPSSSATAVSTASSGGIGNRIDGSAVPVWAWGVGIAVLFVGAIVLLVKRK